MQGLFKRIAVLAVLSCLALPAAAEDRWFGGFRPALNASFNGGTTEFHNSIGVSIGTHIAPFRIWRLRFPTIGIDGLLANKCPPWAPDDSECHATFGVQLAPGIDFVVERKSCHDGKPLEEHSFSIQVARVVVGPLSGSEGWAVKLGYSVRFNDWF